MSFRYACRIGMSAAKIRPQSARSTRASQNAFVKPSSTRITVLAIPPRISAVVRLRKSPRIQGAAYPPAICAPATIAAASPATAYASGSP